MPHVRAAKNSDMLLSAIGNQKRRYLKNNTSRRASPVKKHFIRVLASTRNPSMYL